MQQGSLWQAVLGEIEVSVSRGNFVTWFKNTTLVSQDGDTVVIGVPNVFIKQQLERKYGDLIIETLRKNGISPLTISYKIQSNANKQAIDEPVVLRAAEATPATQATHAAKRSNTLAHTYRLGINERYTFDNFIVGSGNELAHAACQAVAQNPGTKYNPLFLYGGVGIGKTHLIQAVGNQVLANNPKARVVYVSSEQFVQEFVDALRFKKNTDFADFYRGADVLIVDDVQFLAGKEKIQEEFFHTFNALHQANKQIIISSDKPPRDIPTLEERLRSRFVWGMSIDMQNPDLETRCAIVQTKADNHGVDLARDVTEYLATNVQTNIRELEGALNQLLAFCEMRSLEPTLAIASSLLGVSQTRPKHVSARQIVERTARHFQLPLEDILGPKRDKDIVVPRQIAMYMLRSELHLSFPKIAHELGRKDHTTAIHSIEKIEKESQFDADIRAAIMQIKERLYA
ncbi:MAG TPA: chromosomal replication initiator protein DnaA [Candidatus Saccharimonadales bacterium]|jgi:chromosomal replication initiator protein|nr:chromosomal replication initiator protein DnaA [Candidatus Saccharimonadales bacterium]